MRIMCGAVILLVYISDSQNRFGSLASQTGTQSKEHGEGEFLGGMRQTQEHRKTNQHRNTPNGYIHIRIRNRHKQQQARENGKNTIRTQGDVKHENATNASQPFTSRQTLTNLKLNNLSAGFATRHATSLVSPRVHKISAGYVVFKKSASLRAAQKRRKMEGVKAASFSSRLPLPAAAAQPSPSNAARAKTVEEVKSCCLTRFRKIIASPGTSGRRRQPWTGKTQKRRSFPGSTRRLPSNATAAVTSRLNSQAASHASTAFSFSSSSSSSSSSSPSTSNKQPRMRKIQRRRSLSQGNTRGDPSNGATTVSTNYSKPRASLSRATSLPSRPGWNSSGSDAGVVVVAGQSNGTSHSWRRHFETGSSGTSIRLSDPTNVKKVVVLILATFLPGFFLGYLTIAIIFIARHRRCLCLMEGCEGAFNKLFHLNRSTTGLPPPRQLPRLSMVEVSERHVNIPPRPPNVDIDHKLLEGQFADDRKTFMHTGKDPYYEAESDVDPRTPFKDSPDLTRRQWMRGRLRWWLMNDRRRALSGTFADPCGPPDESVLLDEPKPNTIGSDVTSASRQLPREEARDEVSVRASSDKVSFFKSILGQEKEGSVRSDDVMSTDDITSVDSGEGSIVSEDKDTEVTAKMGHS